MRKIIFLIVLFAVMPLLAQSEEPGVKVQTNGGSFEIKTGNQPPPPNPQVIVVRPSPPQVVERTTVVPSSPQVVEKTTIVQPRGGCGLVNVD